MLACRELNTVISALESKLQERKEQLKSAEEAAKASKEDAGHYMCNSSIRVCFGHLSQGCKMQHRFAAALKLNIKPSSCALLKTTLTTTLSSSFYSVDKLSVN